MSEEEIPPILVEFDAQSLFYSYTFDATRVNNDYNYEA